MKTLRVRLKTASYPVYISKWNLRHTARCIQQYLAGQPVFIITSHAVKKFHQKKIQAVFSEYFKTRWISIPDGERFKNLTTVEKILTELSKRGAHRKTVLVAIGGGVVGDITGFVAAVYMRGVSYFNIPATLLAQVDASVGGKTGVDLKTGKNLAGAFYQPRAVFVHTDFLRTLPQREFLCGMAEVIKYALIQNAPFFSWLSRNSQNILRRTPSAVNCMIATCLGTKAKIVEQDERESHRRALLNFGHTLGHAIEQMGKYKKYSHGEAVAMGMVFATQLSHRLKMSRQDLTDDVINILKKYRLPTTLPPYPKEQYKRALSRDKKSQNETVKFIFLKRIGQARIVPLKINKLINYISKT